MVEAVSGGAELNADRTPMVFNNILGSLSGPNKRSTKYHEQSFRVLGTESRDVVILNNSS